MSHLRDGVDDVSVGVAVAGGASRSRLRLGFGLGVVSCKPPPLLLDALDDLRGKEW